MHGLTFLNACAMLFAGIALATPDAAEAGAVTVKIDAGAADGTLLGAAFVNQAAFDAGDMVAVAQGAATGSASVLSFELDKPGTYGLAVYLDKNGNEELDTNMFGAPNEPFGFSMNPKLGFSAPKFEAFSFQYDGSDTELTITLNGN